MNTKLHRLVSIFIIPLVLSGCASVVFVDRSNSLVMPDHVARKILVKYFGREWVENPYLNTATSLFCKSERIPVKFSNILYVSYNDNFIGAWIHLYDNLRPSGRTPLFNCSHYDLRLDVPVSNEEDAKQITEALIALGVPIRGYINFE
ncbi:MAG: hypothetical protein Q7K57_03455 [Burkholderiaceae bacterium]|nr:hypothetical protein [Burkholderiaceae bacterium]